MIFITIHLSQIQHSSLHDLLFVVDHNDISYKGRAANSRLKDVIEIMSGSSPNFDTISILHDSTLSKRIKVLLNH